MCEALHGRTDTTAGSSLEVVGGQNLDIQTTGKQTECCQIILTTKQDYI